MAEISRIEVQPASEPKTPQEAPQEQRSLLNALLSDGNGVLVGTASGVATAIALKVMDKFSDGGDPPAAGQGGGQDSAPPPQVG
jgi:hypothetical protein